MRKKYLISGVAYGLILFLSFFGMTTVFAEETVENDTLQVMGQSVMYQTHVQNTGWQDWVSDGDMSGTQGKSYRLEGIRIKTGIANLGVTYQTHIQNIGWEADTERGWKQDGETSGTEGLSYRLEAIQIKLTGTEAANYDIWYKVHAQNIGWMGWAKNGESAGTAGYSYRLEGIMIRILPKGSNAPGTTENAFKEYPKSEYKEAYRNLVNQAYQEYLSTSKYACHYSLFDIDSDKIPELLLSKGTSEANNTYWIYRFYAGNAVLVGKLSSGHATLYGMGPTNEGLLLLAYQHMLDEQVYQVYLNNMAITRQLVSSGSVGSTDEYFKTAYPVPWAYAYDLSLLN